MKQYFRTFVLAVLAGMAIGIGGVVFLSLDIKIAGAVFFSVGLYIICVQGLNLFTGKVCYTLDNSPAYLADLAVIWIGNFAGALLTAYLMSVTRFGAGLYEKAFGACIARMDDTFLSLFILGIFCGILIYGAVEGFKKTGNPLILIFCVTVFILCGFEHCIADMVYFSLARIWSVDSIVRILVITAGNSVGGMLIPACQRFFAK